jgi:hypothetical protein
MKKHILPVVIVFLALVFVLPGIAIARNTSSSNPDSSLSNQPISAALIGGKYNLIIRAAPVTSSLIGENSQQSSAQSLSNALQVGNYVLSQPKSVDDVSGCCCKNYLTCLHK